MPGKGQSQKGDAGRAAMRAARASGVAQLSNLPLPPPSSQRARPVKPSSDSGWTAIQNAIVAFGRFAESTQWRCVFTQCYGASAAEPTMLGEPGCTITCSRRTEEVRSGVIGRRRGGMLPGTPLWPLGVLLRSPRDAASLCSATGPRRLNPQCGFRRAECAKGYHSSPAAVDQRRFFETGWCQMTGGAGSHHVNAFRCRPIPPGSEEWPPCST